MLLIGSYALIAYTGDQTRKPRDMDIIGSFDELQTITGLLKKETRVRSVPMSTNKTVLHCENGFIVEFELAWSGTAAYSLCELLEGTRQHGGGRIRPFLGHALVVAPLDHLYTLKMSHRYLKNSPHFLKTRNDIMLMRAMNAKIFDAQWLKQREAETYTYKHPKLNVMKGDFFKGDEVPYIYDHDTIHQSMAHATDYRVDNINNRVPSYKLYMKDGAEVHSDKAKFFALPEIFRLWGVLEEAQVLALERSQIPFAGKVDAKRSFDMALQKVCTSITSGWFREYAWENFDKVSSMYEADYVERFWNAVADGTVRKL